MPRTPVAPTNVDRIERDAVEHARDLVAVEEPLQILLEHGPPHAREEAPLAITMRTPGHDEELVIGFLFAEGVMSEISDALSVRHCTRSETPHNVVRVVLREECTVPRHLLERTLTTTSACGVCGERTLDALIEQGYHPVPVAQRSIATQAIREALGSIEGSQVFFRRTGGTHGAALFDAEGSLLLHREDVGRHNALDKLVGAWLGSAQPMHGAFVVVSSRASFELVQKTAKAGFPILVALGAASSLAVETARRFDLTLLGFARGERFNVYTGVERLALGESPSHLSEVEAR